MNQQTQHTALFESERIVLGTLLSDGSSLSEALISLTPECFSTPLHSEMFSAIKDIDEAGGTPDAIKVADNLRRKGVKFDLVELMRVAGCHSFYGIQDHVNIIRYNYAERDLISIAQHSILKAESNDLEIEDILADTGKEIEHLQEFLVGQKQSDHITSSVKKSLESYYIRQDNYEHGIQSGITTGLYDLDRVTGGWQKTHLVIIAARPAMGKTSIVISAAKAAAKTGVPVAIFSLEMSDISLADKLLLSETNISANSFRLGKLTELERQDLERAAGAICKLPIYVDDKASVSISYIRSRCRMLHKQGKCDMVVIDYLQLVNEKRDKNRNREQEIATMSRTAKIMAKELNVPVLLLSQLNRGVESRADKRPLLSDLRESGAIEQDADVVVLIHRPEYYGDNDGKGNPVPKNYGELIIAKNRYGAVGMIPFGHNDSLTKIFDYDNGNAPIDHKINNSEPF